MQSINQNLSGWYHTLTFFSFTDSATISQASPCSTTSFFDHGLQKKGKGFFRSFPENYTANCRNECDNEYMCRDFRLENGTCRLSASDITQHSLTFAQCQESCTNDLYCLGYTYKNGNKKCQLSNDKDFMTTECPECSFYEKTCQSCTYQTLFTSE